MYQTAQPTGLYMPGKIVNRLEELKRQKEERDGVKITWETVSEETGLAYTTVLRWAKDQVDRYDKGTLATFCEYFQCQTGDILVYEEE